MKKLAAGMAIVLLAGIAQLSSAQDNTASNSRTQSGSATTVTGQDACSSQTADGKPANAQTACASQSASSSTSSAPEPAQRPDQKIKTKSNIKND